MTVRALVAGAALALLVACGSSQALPKCGPLPDYCGPDGVYCCGIKYADADGGVHALRQCPDRNMGPPPPRCQ